MLALSPLFLLLGLFLSGFFVAKYLGHSEWWASAFVISLLILFHTAFWLGVFHVAITLWTVLPCLIVATAGAAWLYKRTTMPVDANPALPWTTPERILIVSSGVV